MVRLEYGLTEEIQSATDMVEPHYRAAAMHGTPRRLLRNT